MYAGTWLCDAVFPPMALCFMNFPHLYLEITHLFFFAKFSKHSTWMLPPLKICEWIKWIECYGLWQLMIKLKLLTKIQQTLNAAMSSNNINVSLLAEEMPQLFTYEWFQNVFETSYSKSSARINVHQSVQECLELNKSVKVPTELMISCC